MHIYRAQTFNVPLLDGISQKQIDVHLGLYGGYVKHINLLREQVHDLESQDVEKYAFAIESIRRRLGFEFNGMRMHEFYFSQFEGSPSDDPSTVPVNSPRASSEQSGLAAALVEKYGSWEGFMAHFKKVGMSRGSGWATLAWDPKGRTPHIWWTVDHELGSLADVRILLTMDMWEHSYMVDYMPADKGQHIDSFLRNINWQVVITRFEDARG